MTEHYILIIPSEDAPPEARKELKELQHQFSDEISLILGIPFMLRKGLKYIPTILAWAFEEGGSYGDDSMGRVLKKHLKLMEEVYEELASRVDVKIDRTPTTRFRAFWPSETLDVKEVQEEALLLANSDGILLKISDKKDYWMLFRHAITYKVHTWEKLPFKERIRKHMELENKYLRAWGNFFLKALELRRKYPNVKFWFAIEMI
ncbi:MAG: hypothetical protein FGF51_01345 [Candidatus Brockarchaeota archaeon]|nr:hypothetical protein [Candidatus Brockarchaeota archaeon]